MLNHVCKGIPKESLHLPGAGFRRSGRSAERPHTAGHAQPAADVRPWTAGGTGYVSILPVDQGIEHSAGASFAKNPAMFDPENIVKLAIEGGCNAVASTLGVLGACARKYAHKIPFLLKFNHNEFLTYPNKYDQIFFASVKQARDMGAVAVGATIYFGSAESSPADRGGEQGLRDRARDGHGHGAVVLPAQQRVQDRTRITTCPPT